MKIEIDTLKYAKMLTNNGFASNQAKTLTESFTAIEIKNVLNRQEVMNMIKEIFTESDARHKAMREEDERRLKATREEDERKHKELLASYEMRMQESRLHSEKEIAAIRTGWHWAVGTIVTVGIALAGYMTTLILYTHH